MEIIPFSKSCLRLQEEGRSEQLLQPTGSVEAGGVAVPWAQKDSERYLPPVLQRAHGSGSWSDCVGSADDITGVPDAHWSRLDGAGVSGSQGAPQPPRFSLAQGSQREKTGGEPGLHPRPAQPRPRPWICDQKQPCGCLPLPSISQAAWIRTRGQ